MAVEFVAYIDEAGDEGLGKLAAGPVGGQSRWLILGACLVARADDLKLPAFRDKILARFPQRSAAKDLHFRHLKHAQRTVVCQEISQMPIGICVAMSHKVTIPGTRWEATFKKPGFLYNWLVRWLLERLTYQCKLISGGKPCSLKVVFSRRANTNYQAMRNYLILMRDKKEVMKPVRSILWNVLDIDSIIVENHSKWAGLQIADCVTSAFFVGVEPNAYGNYEHQYGHVLKNKLIKDRGSVLNCGLVPVPSLTACKVDAQQKEFFLGCMKK